MGTVKWYNAEIGHQNFRKLQVADAIEKARAKRAEPLSPVLHDLRGDMKFSEVPLHATLGFHQSRRSFGLAVKRR